MGLAASWAHIVAWCRDHAPETAAAIRPPAGPVILARAEAATGAAWPEDLRAWYRLADGTERTTAGRLLPFHRPLPLASVIEHWTMTTFSSTPARARWAAASPSSPRATPIPGDPGGGRSRPCWPSSPPASSRAEPSAAGGRGSRTAAWAGDVVGGPAAPPG